MENTNNVRPTFGVGSVNNNTENAKRKEMGAMWTRKSKRTNKEFFSIKISLPKSKLKDLLNKEGDLIDIPLIAFQNEFKKEDDKRPNFRIYEDSEEVKPT